jgi:hypothetical protein
MAPDRQPSSAFSWASLAGSDGQPSPASGIAPGGAPSARALLELAAAMGADELFVEVSTALHEELSGDVWQVGGTYETRG